MKVGYLEIRTIPAKIEFSGKDAELSSSNIKPELIMSKQKGTLDIDQIPAKVEIDQSRCLADEGHKKISDLTAEYAQKAIQDAHEATAQFAHDGQVLLQSIRNKKLIPQMHLSQAFPQQQISALNFIPSQLPDIDVIPSELHIQATPDQLNIDWNTSTMAQVEMTPAYLDIQMTQYPDVHFTYHEDSGNILDTRA